MLFANLLRGPLPLIVLAALAAFFGVLVLFRRGGPAAAVANVAKRRLALRLWSRSKELGLGGVEHLLEDLALGQDDTVAGRLHELAEEAETKAQFEARFRERLAALAKTPEGQAQILKELGPAAAASPVNSPGGTNVPIPTQ